MSHIQIAIDGPRGAGKSSLSKAIARELGMEAEGLSADLASLRQAVRTNLAQGDGNFIFSQGIQNSAQIRRFSGKSFFEFEHIVSPFFISNFMIKMTL